MSYTKTIILCKTCHRCPCTCCNISSNNNISCNCSNISYSCKDTNLHIGNNINSNNCNIKSTTCKHPYKNKSKQYGCKKCNYKKKTCIKTSSTNNVYCCNKCNCKYRPRCGYMNPLWWALLLFLI